MQSKIKKISFISIIVMIVGSSVGAGIFMKNAEILRNAHANIYLAVLAWVIAGIGCLAMGVALIELTSATYKNNRGILGWTKTFTNRFTSNSAKNFMAYIFVPFDRFIMPIYFIMKLQDAFQWNASWWVIFLIGIAISIWFTILSGLYTNVGNIQNWVITIIKIIPIVLVIFWGYIKADPSVIHTDITSTDSMWLSSPSSAFSPIFGLLASIPAIYFAIDGFYTAVGVTSEMKKPSKAPLAVILGIATIIVLYLLISCAMLVSSITGGVDGIGSLNTALGGHLITVVDVMIGIGILGIENGYCMMAPRMYEEMIKADELPFSKMLLNKLNAHRPLVGVCISLTICVPYYVVFAFIGAFAFYNMSGYSADYINPQTASLYSFADLLGNWSSFFIFILITVAIIGGIVNRKTKKVETKKNRYFLVAAYITAVLNIIALLYVIVSTFVDFGVFVNNPAFYTDGNNPNWVGGMLKIIVLVAIALFSICPDPIRDAIIRFKKRRIARNIDKVENNSN